MHDLQTAMVKITVVIRDLQAIKQLIEPFLLETTPSEAKLLSSEITGTIFDSHCKYCEYKNLK